MVACGLRMAPPSLTHVMLGGGFPEAVHVRENDSLSVTVSVGTGCTVMVGGTVCVCYVCSGIIILGPVTNVYLSTTGQTLNFTVVDFLANTTICTTCVLHSIVALQLLARTLKTLYMCKLFLYTK